jgi:hypothetical protein
LVGGDARITVDGTRYEVDADLAGETVLLWWGLFDQDLYVEHGDERYGPYHPVGGPIPLYRYRQHRKGRREQRADRVTALAAALQVPRAVLDGCPAFAPEPVPAPPRRPRQIRGDQRGAKCVSQACPGGSIGPSRARAPSLAKALRVRRGPLPWTTWTSPIVRQHSRQTGVQFLVSARVQFRMSFDT